MKKNKIDSIEKLMNLAIHYQSERWTLIAAKRDVYIDEAAGDAFNDRMHALLPLMGAEYWEKRDELLKERPPMRKEEWYILARRNSRAARIEFYLSKELGQLIDSVWTKKARRYRNGEENVGLLTLPGILKRLGNTEIGGQIAEENERRGRENAMNRRNATRSRIAAKAVELLELLQSDEASELAGNKGDLMLRDWLAAASVRFLELEE